jgi:hypothetical protein
VGATVYLVTHGVIPPTAAPAEARDLATAFCEATAAWVRVGLRRAGSRAGWPG